MTLSLTLQCMPFLHQVSLQYSILTLQYMSFLHQVSLQSYLIPRYHFCTRPTFNPILYVTRYHSCTRSVFNPILSQDTIPAPGQSSILFYHKIPFLQQDSLQSYLILRCQSCSRFCSALQCSENLIFKSSVRKEMDYHCIEKPYILFLVQY